MLQGSHKGSVALQSLVPPTELGRERCRDEDLIYGCIEPHPRENGARMLAHTPQISVAIPDSESPQSSPGHQSGKDRLLALHAAREVHPADLRRSLVELTLRGAEVLARLVPAHLAKLDAYGGRIVRPMESLLAEKKGKQIATQEKDPESATPIAACSL